MKSIIISGISGFMGYNVSNYLKDSYEIVGLSRDKNKVVNGLTYEEIYKMRLDDYFAFIHLAGKAHDLKNTNNDYAYIDANTNLTIKLFDLFLKSKCKIFIFMSSVKAIADTLEGVLTEETEANPQTPYGKSKRAAEEYILSKKIPKNKKVYILRPCMVHGPNNKGNLNLLYSIINRGIPYPLGSYENKRSFLSVQNLNFIIKELIIKQPKSDTFNVADDKAISTVSLVKLIAKYAKKKVVILRVPKVIINFTATAGNFFKLPLNKNRLDKLTENYVVSNTKIKAQLGKKLPLSTEEGLKKTIQSFNIQNDD